VFGVGLKNSECREIDSFVNGLGYLSSSLDGFFQGFKLGVIRARWISQIDLDPILETIERIKNPLTMVLSITTGELLPEFSPLRDGRSIEIHD
jgi:hypothetical protein